MVMINFHFGWLWSAFMIFVSLKKKKKMQSENALWLVDQMVTWNAYLQ